MSYNISYPEHLIKNLYNKIKLKIAKKNQKKNSKTSKRLYLYIRIKNKFQKPTKSLLIYKSLFFQPKRDFQIKITQP